MTCFTFDIQCDGEVCGELLVEQFIWTSERGAITENFKNSDVPSQDRSRVRGSAGSVQGGLRNFDVLWPSYRVIVLEEIVLDWKVVCSTNVKKIL